MQPLTDSGWRKINEVARRYGVSTEAVMSLLQSLLVGNGTMAQFHHRELGGGGQWMRGGMTMVGDLFNHALKAKVDGLCSDLCEILAQQPFAAPAPAEASPWQGGQRQYQGGQEGAGYFAPGASGGPANWWPAELGYPSGSGAQNDVRYAYFPGTRRLAVESDGHVTVYDTLDNRIGGVSQQQGGGSSMTFTSQYGTIDLATLPVVPVAGAAQGAPQPCPEAGPPPSAPQGAGTGQESDIIATIERLADLQKKGILSAEEFAAKKADLLSRL